VVSGAAQVFATLEHAGFGAVHSEDAVTPFAAASQKRTRESVMDMRLELVPLVSTDVDRSKAFYAERVGFHVDHDVEPGNGMRVVQLTPPGSACSIVFGVGISDPDAAPVRNLHLVVENVDEARAALTANGVAVSEILDMGGVRYAFFSDPDGNSWALQQLST
jgi:predicted enzyme related to lactoylglutathione lyase